MKNIKTEQGPGEPEPTPYVPSGPDIASAMGLTQAAHEILMETLLHGRGEKPDPQRVEDVRFFLYQALGFLTDPAEFGPDSQNNQEG